MQKRIIITSALGTFLEWTEYSFYGYMASKISSLFFPHIDPTAGLLATFGIFALGFLMRPIGGILFGHLGDKRGRKSALSISIFLMGIATLSIGLLPTYDQIGILAPILLTVCRLLQGLAVSGEYNGASIFLIEHAQGKYPYLAGSWVGMAAAAGMVMGAVGVGLASHPSLPDWSWRLPFFFGFFSCLIGFYLRNNIKESPAFVTILHHHQLIKIPLLEIFKKYKRELIQTCAVAAFVGIYVYACNLYLATFLIEEAKFPTHSAILLAAFGEGIVVLFFPIFARAADKIGGRSVMLLGLIGASISAPMVFRLGFSQSVLLVASGQLLFGICNAAACAPMFKLLFDCFPTNIRYTGISFAWGLSVAIFGGTTPLIAEYFVNGLSFIYGPAAYASMSAMIAFMAVLTLRENNTHPGLPPRSQMESIV